MPTHYKCPECRGAGQQLFAYLYPTGHAEVWEECKFCDGEGEFEAEDFLVLKLEGKV